MPMPELAGTAVPPMVVLRPGDRVLIALTEDIPAEEVQDFTVQLRRSFPQVSFVVIGGIAGLAVQAGGGDG